MRHLLWLCVGLLLLAVPAVAQDEDVTTAQDLADSDGQFADVNGASIYYIERGDSENPTVILIHGFGGSTFTWRDTIPALVDAGYYVVALDLPPFGLSDKSGDVSHTRSAYADTVAGLMDLLEIETATIVGHSMGGTTTAYFAVQYPERVENLVFVAGGIFDADGASLDADGDSGGSPLGSLAGIDFESEQAIFILETALIPATFASIIETAYYDPSLMTDEVVMGYARPILIDGWAEGFVAYWSTEDTVEISLDDFAETVNVPTLIMWGEADTWVPIEMGSAMNEALSDVMFVTYPEVGHLPMEEDVDAFNEDLVAFLSGE